MTSTQSSLVEQANLDVRCRMCKAVGGAYCDECAAAVFAVHDLWRERNKLREVVKEIADARLAPPEPTHALWMQTRAREVLGRNVWTNA